MFVRYIKRKILQIVRAITIETKSKILFLVRIVSYIMMMISVPLENQVNNALP